jgi:sugar phosphate permease
VPITILSVAGVQDHEYGLASGLVNTSQQIGGALGLAVLTTIATQRTNHLTATHHPIGQALTLGFHLGFLGAGAFVVLAIIAAAFMGRAHPPRGVPADRRDPRSTSEIPRARRNRRSVSYSPSRQPH